MAVNPTRLRITTRLQSAVVGSSIFQGVFVSGSVLSLGPKSSLICRATPHHCLVTRAGIVCVCVCVRVCEGGFKILGACVCGEV